MGRPLNLRRGDFVTASFPGDLKKPRPGLIIQADEFIDGHRTLLLCPLTTFASESRLFRPVFLPSAQNGLEHRSEAMIDKLSPVRKDGIRQRIGTATHEELLTVELALITIAGLDRYLVFDDPIEKEA
ncbi:type II toxin-antitoxin system PemK/MazF family toxin [Fulvimarina sp. 2208YS6-2-32]|uniref:Type II toxin-antitoxin system PemK/MazF family toxin n=1 Tax=Fulvimarina uroteuthidis TaxID=3098149 RepID=A0ABU5I505_9HYPH|nr:type II toxin-antitoxin system PemK/MazF family toxin [Fulvimarina sp. 2208YS6-2-32]MDY8109808.1 type II toxin-antitoxin system PemK/MazF family toxin [Fulvimarina sp. 2208YS6-2-32]